MKNFVVILFFFLAYSQANCQYEVLKDSNGVVVSTKWVSEKWYKKNSPKVLAIKVENNNQTAVTYSFDLEIFQNGLHVESSSVEKKTLKAGAKTMGRFNGISFIPTKLTASDIATKNYQIELMELEVEVITAP